AAGAVLIEDGDVHVVGAGRAVEVAEDEIFGGAALRERAIAGVAHGIVGVIDVDAPGIVRAGVDEAAALGEECADAAGGVGAGVDDGGDVVDGDGGEVIAEAAVAVGDSA